MLGKDASSEDALESFDLRGKKIAYIFSWGRECDRREPEDPNQQDVDRMAETFKDLGFEFDPEMYDEDHSDDSSDSEYYFGCRPEKKDPVVLALRDLRISDVVEITSWIATRAAEASCIIMYFITCEIKNPWLNAFERNIPVSLLWHKLRKINCPKLFFIQANIMRAMSSPSALMNSAGGGRESSIPESANVLHAYLPNFGDADMSVAEILKEELCKPYDINTVLTSVIDRLTSVIDRVNTKCGRPSPKFGSTLLKQLYLANRPVNPIRDQPPSYSISEGKKCLVYAFLFGEFEACTPLTTLVDFDIKQMSSAFNSIGFDFEFCVKNGHMTVKEFHAKLAEIVQDKKKMEECECIMIFLSSHGEGDGVLYASNGLISHDIAVTALSSCKELVGKPKLIFVDACRGSDFERPLRHDKSSPSATIEERGSRTMCSIRVWHSMYENDLCRLRLYERPEMSDVMIVLSSMEGRVSVYRVDQGSHFMKNLCEKLTESGKDYDLMTLLNMLMCKVAHMSIMYRGMELKQQITFTSSLRKIVRFPKR